MQTRKGGKDKMKKKIRKLTAIIMLAITTLLCFSVFSACGEKAKYEAQVVFTVGSRYDSFEDTVSVVLTKEKNIETIDYGLDTDVIPVFAKYQIIKVQNEEKTIEKSFYLYPNGTTPPEIDIPFTPTEYPPNYKITDK